MGMQKTPLNSFASISFDFLIITYDQLLALSYGDRVKENQRGKMAFVVDMDKKHAAEALLNSLASHHKELILQVPVYLTTLWVQNWDSWLQHYFEVPVPN